MPIIKLNSTINAPIEIVFDLARSIDLHLLSLEHTNEKAIAGRTSGLINKGETVTWRAKHLGFTQELTSLVTEVEPYYYFVDEMKKGAFHSFKHEHHFKVNDNGSIYMQDIFTYKSPYGILGRFADFLFLKKYMERLLEKRNATIKKVAESDQWKTLPEMDKHYNSIQQ